MGCENNLNTLIDFIKDVYESEAAALVISTGKYVQSIPNNVVEFAEEIGLPLIQIPWHIRFSTIVETVLLDINDRNQNHLNRFKQLQKRLLEYFLNGSTLFEAAELIRQETGHKTIIVSSNGTIKGISHDSDKLLEIVNNQINIFTINNDTKYNDINTLKDFISYRINSKNISYGYLILENKDNDKNKENYYNELYINRHILAPITLWFDREQTIFETQMQHQDNFIWKVINSEIEEYDSLIKQGQSIGFYLEKPYISIVGKLSFLESQYNSKKQSIHSYEEWKFSTIKDIKSIIFRHGKKLNKSTMVTYQEDRLIIFLETDVDNKEHINDRIIKFIYSFLDEIEELIKLKYPKIIFSWGISDHLVNTKLSNKNSFSKSYMDAKISLEIFSKDHKPGYRNICESTNIYRLLAMISNNPQSEKIIKEIIGDLIQYDKEKKLDLIKTFSVYTQNNGNVSQTARDLHLHRQSLVYRVKLIENITELSLDNSDHVFLLELCIRIWSNKNLLNI